MGSKVYRIEIDIQIIADAACIVILRWIPQSAYGHRASISEWVGHSSIKATKNVYGHMDFKSKLDMAQGLSEKIGRSGSLDPEPPPTSPEPTPAHLIRSDGEVGNNTRGANSIIHPVALHNVLLAISKQRI